MEAIRTRIRPDVVSVGEPLITTKSSCTEATLSRIRSLCRHPLMRAKSPNSCPVSLCDVWACYEVCIISSAGGKLFWFTSLLHHYVADHGYMPSDEFLEAVNYRFSLRGRLFHRFNQGKLRRALAWRVVA